jgi:RNA recognition motif-containing protein
MKKLFVSGFPLEITEMELALLIAPYGDIETIKIVRDKRTKKCKGYAFVEMKKAESAANAAASLNGTINQGRVFTVNVNPNPSEPQSTPQKKYTSTSSHAVSTETERPKIPGKPEI